MNTSSKKSKPSSASSLSKLVTKIYLGSSKHSQASNPQLTNISDDPNVGVGEIAEDCGVAKGLQKIQVL